jgi:hypothetical protein
MKLRFTILLLGALMASPAAWAVEALSTEELVSHCDKYYDEQAAEDRVFRVRYIQGVIDGAVATDERVARNVVKEYEKNANPLARDLVYPTLRRNDPCGADD